MKETKYESFVTGRLAEGCKLCVKGEKMVLFVTGLCSRGCDFCPLSKLRKSVDKTYANERPVKFLKDLFKEVRVSGAKGCSITGGDPLLKIKRTEKFGNALKKKFGKKFHIHIYLSTTLVDEKNLKIISNFADEVRFHPDFDKPIEEEIEKIKLASKFWKKKNIGIEVPSFPDKINKIYNFILKTKDYFSFLNLNELEAGEVLGPSMTKKYKLNENGYTVKNSILAGKKLISLIEKDGLKLNMNLCTSKLKVWHQYGERLKNYKPFKFSKMTDEGTLVYFSVSVEEEKFLKKEDFHLDSEKNQLIINPTKALSLKDKVEVYKIEEYPTYDREEIFKEKL
ncbi:radical SAM protein [Candidatus Pacearchaeota archaeon CG10_big_fil_rev_8_21_14_0_10_32_42]|nr:MAG: radical SAM protein [Candidatus Pacearchaeota archaeon CG10_big_fil_rev_8_21_14_0_10_32_42]